MIVLFPIKTIGALVLVVPVLVGNAKMPGADDLPADLQPLWRRNARVLYDSHWDYDAEELVKSIPDS